MACPIIFITFDQIFPHGIENRRIPRYSIPWGKFRSKLTQIIAQTLFFHFDEMKTILWILRTDGYNMEFDVRTFLSFCTSC